MRTEPVRVLTDDPSTVLRVMIKLAAARTEVISPPSMSRIPPARTAASAAVLSSARATVTRPKSTARTQIPRISMSEKVA